MAAFAQAIVAKTANADAGAEHGAEQAIHRIDNLRRWRGGFNPREAICRRGVARRGLMKGRRRNRAGKAGPIRRSKSNSKMDPRFRGNDAANAFAPGANAPLHHLTLTSFTSNCTATFGGNGVRGSAP
jgi:hypothetical protein